METEGESKMESKYRGFEIMVQVTDDFDVTEIIDNLTAMFCKEDEDPDHECPLVYIGSSGGTYEEVDRWFTWCEHLEEKMEENFQSGDEWQEWDWGDEELGPQVWPVETSLPTDIDYSENEAYQLETENKE